MTIFDPNHPRNMSYHAKKSKAIHDQKLQNMLNSGPRIFKESDLLALPQPSSASQSEYQVQQSITSKRKITIGGG